MASDTYITPHDWHQIVGAYLGQQARTVYITSVTVTFNLILTLCYTLPVTFLGVILPHLMTRQRIAAHDLQRKCVTKYAIGYLQSDCYAFDVTKQVRPPID